MFTSLFRPAHYNHSWTDDHSSAVSYVSFNTRILCRLISHKSRTLDQYFLADAVFGNFTEYGACSASCGEGIQTRTRMCMVTTENCMPTPTSVNCNGSLEETEMRCCVAFDLCGTPVGIWELHKIIFRVKCSYCILCRWLHVSAWTKFIVLASWLWQFYVFNWPNGRIIMCNALNLRS